MRTDTRTPEGLLGELITDHADENGLDAGEVAAVLAPILMKRGREVVEQFITTRSFTLRRLKLLNPTELKRFRDIQTERQRLRQEVSKMFRLARQRDRLAQPPTPTEEE